MKSDLTTADISRYVDLVRELYKSGLTMGEATKQAQEAIKLKVAKKQPLEKRR